MTPYEAFCADERRESLSGGKEAALESIYRDLENVLNGDDNFPTNWWHLADKARIAAGYAPNQIWSEDA